MSASSAPPHELSCIRPAVTATPALDPFPADPYPDRCQDLVRQAGLMIGSRCRVEVVDVPEDPMSSGTRQHPWARVEYVCGTRKVDPAGHTEILISGLGSSVRSDWLTRTRQSFGAMIWKRCLPTLIWHE